MNSQTLSQSAQQLEAQIVITTAVTRNASALYEVLKEGIPGRMCVVSDTMQGVYDAIAQEAAVVILTEEVIGDFQDLEKLRCCLEQQPDWSDIPVIMLLKDCHRFPSCLEILHQTEFAGSVILLEKPIKAEILLSVVRSSLRDRDRQYALRDTLDRLQESNEILESFAHTAAHELRNPLGVIKGSLGFVLARQLAPEKRKQLLTMANRTAKEMDQTLRILLNYGKLQDNATHHFTQVEMQPVLEQATTGIQDLIEERQAEVSGQNLPTVWGQQQLLVQLLRNLIKNAIVHNPNQFPRVMIYAESVGEKWRFFVQDNGEGIPREDQTKIFAMFQQGSKKHKGSGIGLALCRRIVEKHQGAIGVESEVGQGSRFYFDLLKAEE